MVKLIPRSNLASATPGVRNDRQKKSVMPLPRNASNDLERPREWWRHAQACNLGEDVGGNQRCIPSDRHAPVAADDGRLALAERRASSAMSP